jgi:hypothetical protein
LMAARVPSTRLRIEPLKSDCWFIWTFLSV